MPLIDPCEEDGARHYQSRTPEPAAQWGDPRVQAVYDVLTGDEMPPDGQHWEGWAARRIVDALFPNG